jgi:putative transposase
MTNDTKVFLYVHAIWSVKDRAPLLKKPVRAVLFPHMQQSAAEKGIRLLSMNGVEDHVHALIQLHPAQNLSQVIRMVRDESAQWINGNKLMDAAFEWHDTYAAYTVNPSGVKQVMDFIANQEEYHKNKTLDNELEAFAKAPA